MVKLQEFFHKTQDDLFIQCEMAFDKVLARKDLGFHELPLRDHWSVAQKWAEEVNKKSSRLVVIGMGGSSLGGLALVEALSPEVECVEFWNDTDPLIFYERLEKLEDINKTHWLVISKSGKTLEVLSMLNLMIQYFQGKSYDFKPHCSVITQWDGNPLHQWAKNKKLPLFEHPLDVGGRFSVLSPVGLFPLAFSGVDLLELQNGARWAREQKILVSDLSSQFLMSFQRGEYISVFWPYCYKLKSFCEWLAQLWAESLAKKETIMGEEGPRVSSPFFCVGARDQHSVLQQIADGYKDKMLCFVGVENLSSMGPSLKENQFKGFDFLKSKNLGQIYQVQYESTKSALKEKGVSQMSLSLESLDAFCMGGLVMIFEMSIAVLGETLKIDAFDQPGVELGKQKALKRLSEL